MLTNLLILAYELVLQVLSYAGVPVPRTVEAYCTKPSVTGASGKLIHFLKSSRIFIYKIDFWPIERLINIDFSKMDVPCHFNKVGMFTVV